MFTLIVAGFIVGLGLIVIGRRMGGRNARYASITNGRSMPNASKWHGTGR